MSPIKSASLNLGAASDSSFFFLFGCFSSVVLVLLFIASWDHTLWCTSFFAAIHSFIAKSALHCNFLSERKEDNVYLYILMGLFSNCGWVACLSGGRL